jgi:hypothetical protein
LAAMKGILSMLVFAAAVSGCAVSKDGVGFAQRAPDANQVAKTKDQLQHNADSAAATADSVQPGILIIGTTGPFRTIKDKDRDGFYAAYVKVAGQWHPGEAPRMDAAAFQDKLAGWASIQTFGIPGMMSWRTRVLVPRALVHDAQFASAAGSFMFGTSGDLVVAKTDHDGLAWLERVLCRDDDSYHSCEKNYQAGIFDANTGQELARDRKPKTDGALVDVSSYLSLTSDAARHSAHELDLRSSSRCDCNDARPGSIRTVVPAPQINDR